MPAQVYGVLQSCHRCHTEAVDEPKKIARALTQQHAFPGHLQRLRQVELLHTIEWGRIFATTLIKSVHVMASG